MATYTGSPAEIARLFQQKELERQERVIHAVHEACALGAEVVAKAAPVDQGLLKGSTRFQLLDKFHSRIYSDAPHAGIVELGSRPHVPPLKPLLGWVKRHARSLQVARTQKAPGGGKVRRNVRLVTRIKRTVRKLFASVLKRFGIGPKSSRGPRTQPAPVQLTDEQVLQIARAIQFKIARDGTKPTHFTRKQLPRLRRILGVTIRKRIRD